MRLSTSCDDDIVSLWSFFDFCPIVFDFCLLYLLLNTLISHYICYAVGFHQSFFWSIFWHFYDIKFEVITVGVGVQATFAWWWEVLWFVRTAKLFGLLGIITEIQNRTVLVLFRGFLASEHTPTSWFGMGLILRHPKIKHQLWGTQDCNHEPAQCGPCCMY